MQHQPLKKDEILASKELAFTDRREANYPQLMRLTLDFGLHVLEVERKAFSLITKRFFPSETFYVLVDHDYRNSHIAYSPHCKTLRQLEAYVYVNNIDILHEHLFGGVLLES